MRLLHVVPLVLAAVVAPAAAAAHDFWIEPRRFAIPHPEPLAIGLRVGEALRGDPVSRREAAIQRFTIVGPGGEAPVLGGEGEDPAGVARPTTPGVHVIAYRGRRSGIELEPDLFEAYLREEGLEHVSAARRAANATSRPAREVYSRCAKALVRVGQVTDDGWARAAGLDLEIVPERDPWWSTGGATPFRVIHRGAPAVGLQVVALEQRHPEDRRLGRTDAAGRVALELGPGRWIVKTVHMVEAPPQTGADWESLWASLTLEIEGP